MGEASKCIGLFRQLNCYQLKIDYYNDKMYYESLVEVIKQKPVIVINRKNPSIPLQKSSIQKERQQKK